MKRFVTLTLAGVLGLATSVLPAPVATAATTCKKSHLHDVDGDGAADTVVGVPSYRKTASAQKGVVDVHGTRSGKHLLTPAAIGAKAGSSGGFGSAIAMADLDGDGCVDAVIGAPNEKSDVGSGGQAGPGQVYVVFGSPTGLKASTAVRIPRPATTGADGFGSALTLLDRRVEEDDPRDHYLYVGAPGAGVDGQAQAGEVWRYRISTGGSKRVTVTRLEARHPGADGVPGTATAGARFGEIQAQIDGGADGVLVGVPSTEVNGAAGAGAVWSLPVAADGSPGTPAQWTQDSPGVPGAAEAGDRFGAALGSRGASIVVGVPGEDVDTAAGTLKDAGLAQVLHLEAGGSLAPRRAITQASTGVPGAVEAGDRFGAAVAVGGSINGMGSGTVDAAIGAPGEDLGKVTNAGTITLVAVSDLGPGDGSAAPRVLRQGSRLTGKPEAGDALGSVLAVTGGVLGFDEDSTDLLMIGVPAENVGTTKDAGMVQWSPLGLRAPQANYTFSAGVTKTRHYGRVLPSSAT